MFFGFKNQTEEKKKIRLLIQKLKLSGGTFQFVPTPDPRANSFQFLPRIECESSCHTSYHI
jgi:hypothetical protein